MQHLLGQKNAAVTGRGLASALLFASVFAATSGCLQQNVLTQDCRTTQSGRPGQTQVASASTPYTPGATNNLIATGRNLLDITTDPIKTRNQMSDGGSTTRDVDNMQRVGRGHTVLNSVRSIAGGPQQSCG